MVFCFEKCGYLGAQAFAILCHVAIWNGRKRPYTTYFFLKASAAVKIKIGAWILVDVF